MVPFFPLQYASIDLVDSTPFPLEYSKTYLAELTSSPVLLSTTLTEKTGTISFKGDEWNFAH